MMNIMEKLLENRFMERDRSQRSRGGHGVASIVSVPNTSGNGVKQSTPRQCLKRSNDRSEFRRDAELLRYEVRRF